MRKVFYHLKLKTKLIILICFVFILAVVAENIYIIRIVNNEYYTNARQQVENVADLIASSTEISDSINNPNAVNLSSIQTIAEAARELAQVQFVVVFDMQGIRFSHPNMDKIGQLIVGGDGDRALQGESYLSTAKGTLGPSIRAFRPIYAAEHRQIGAVMVGQTLTKIDHLAERTSQPILFTLIVSLAIAVLLALLLSRNIKNVLLGLEPFEIVKLFEERDAIIRTVKEGIVVINRDCIVTQINDEARRILRTPYSKEDIIDQQINKIIPNTRLYEVMQTGQPEYDCEQKINGVVILTNRIPLFVKGKLMGAIASFRDMTEVRQLAENLTGVNSYADALRSQSHEFNNKLHVIYGLAFSDSKEQLIDYIEQTMGTHQAQVESITQSIKDPIIAGFLNSKFSRTRELGVTFHLHIDGILPAILDSSVTHGLITILGNLIDNALDAVQFLDDKHIIVNLVISQDSFVIEVKDDGEGILVENINQIFSKGYSTKGDLHGFGLYLVLVSLDELAGNIELCAPDGEQGACFRVILPLDILYRGKSDD